jgi:hypothetical protein
MFDRISASWDLACSSWQVLRQQKQLIVFPVISGLLCTLVLISFAVPMALIPPWRQFFGNNGNIQAPWWVYVVAFAFYFCNYFVIVFCNAALISCALVGFQGGSPTVADGFRAASGRLPQIVAWALMSATIGLLLKAIENAHEKAGQLISALLGTAWTVITYFVVPVLVVEKVGPFQAMSRSVEVLRRTWGEALVGRLGLGLILFLLFLPCVLLGALGIVITANQGLIGLVFLAADGVYLLVWMAIGSALSGIFLSALYLYAACDRVPAGFNADAMRGAFARKK